MKRVKCMHVFWLSVSNIYGRGKKNFSLPAFKLPARLGLSSPGLPLIFCPMGNKAFFHPWVLVTTVENRYWQPWSGGKFVFTRFEKWPFGFRSSLFSSEKKRRKKFAFSIFFILPLPSASSVSLEQPRRPSEEDRRGRWLQKYCSTSERKICSLAEFSIFSQLLSILSSKRKMNYWTWKNLEKIIQRISSQSAILKSCLAAIFSKLTLEIVILKANKKATFIFDLD